MTSRLFVLRPVSGAAAASQGRHKLTSRTRERIAIEQLFESLVIAGLESREEVVLIERKVLREGNRHELLLRINLAIRRGGAVPAKLSNRRRRGQLAQVGRHFDAQAKSFRARRGLVIRE